MLSLQAWAIQVGKSVVWREVKKLHTVRLPESGSAKTFWTVTWPFLGVEQAIIPHVKEEILLIKKNLNFHLVTAIFKYIFELLWGLQTVLHILGCHSVTSWRNPDYHSPIWRGYPELSYGPNSLNISSVIRELEFEETFRWISPSIPHPKSA